MSAQLHSRLALALPDVAKWVETRSMLLSGDCEILGLEEQAGMDFVLRDPQTRLISVVGWPAREAIVDATSRSRAKGVVVAQFDNQGPVVAALPRWRKTAATLHLLGDAPRLPIATADGVRLLTPDEISALRGLPEDLRSELEAATQWSSIAATIVDRQPVSFCYAASVTESLWDISIDTLERYRRQGSAALAAAYMIRRMHAMGKQPVWGALETNAASLALAAKLGFEPVDRVVVFQPPD